MARAALDVNLVLGEAGDDLAESEQRLAERAVAAAWATAAPARSGNPDEHDDRLARACKSSASHHSVPVLVPPTGVAGGFERARRLTASAGCRVIRLCPGGHRYPLLDWVLSPVPELCEREGVAVLLDFAPDAVKWAEAVTFARRYSPVPMVILETELEADRVVPAALDAAPNLLLHIGRPLAVQNLLYLVGVFGSYRFVWGSSEGADADVARRAIENAEGLDEEDRTAILSGNAQALQNGAYAEAWL
jgi:hypothetical protein